MTKNVFWILVVVLAILIGLYPVIYFIIDRKFGLLSSKSDEVLTAILWNITFYTHIVFGGIALLIGWTQFREKLRNRNLSLHRKIGKVYIVSVVLSSLAGIYIGFFATGGIVSSLGFISLGFIWLYVTVMAFLTIKKRKVEEHKKFMIYSYSLCFAAVTLRIWLPLLSLVFRDFNAAYITSAWLCWIPNLIFATRVIQKNNPHHLTTNSQRFMS